MTHLAGPIRQGQLRQGHPGPEALTAAIPMDSPYCSCKLTRVLQVRHKLNTKVYAMKVRTARAEQGHMSKSFPRAARPCSI